MDLIIYCAKDNINSELIFGLPYTNTKNRRLPKQTQPLILNKELPSP
jgi:hypothetical protein